MSISTIRAKVDTEIARRVGTWFTVREIQDKLKINPSTLKPLIMKYARENLLRRRHVKGTARSVEFSPASQSMTAFQSLLLDAMPYRSAVTVRETRIATSKKDIKSASKSTPMKSTVAKSAAIKKKSTTKKKSTKKTTTTKKAVKKTVKKAVKKAAPKAAAPKKSVKRTSKKRK